MQPVCLMSVLCIFVTFGECKTPGLQTRITEKALNYGKFNPGKPLVMFYLHLIVH